MMIRRVMTAALCAGLAASFATSASADTRWQNHHPRREQVNNRLARQNRRIHQERIEGDITGAQAKALHQDVHAIRAQERADAATNHGHITKAEQRTLNGELNANSRAIGK